MNSTNFTKFIEDFSSITSSDAKGFERILKKFPYFQTSALFLAKANPIQQNTQRAALRSADRRILRTWLDDKYRNELEAEKQKQEEAKKIILEVENKENKENINSHLDINTDAINAFDKFDKVEKVEETNTPQEQNLQKKEPKQEQHPSQNQQASNAHENSFFDELENDNSLLTTPTLEKEMSSSSFFEELQQEDKTQNTIKEKEKEKEATTNFFDTIDDTEETQKQVEESFFKEQSDINEALITEPLLTQIPSESTDASFFDEIDQSEDTQKQFEEPIFKEQSDINDPLLTEPLLTQIPNKSTDASFFDDIEELESNDKIFGDAQKDLDAYDFPDFEDEKKEMDKNQKANEGGSFFDDI